ncbi:hypothetical protein [Malikia spinosa]|nr:hypothetical protein [Malikia spinosa]
MVERINKLIKEVQPSFGLVSGSQRERSSAQVRWLTGTGQKRALSNGRFLDFWTRGLP